MASLALGVFYVAGAEAVHTAGGIEMDGNATNDPAVTGDDWDNVCHQVVGSDCSTSSNTTGATSVDWVAEANLNSTIFTGGGSKDPQNINQWAWKDGAGGLPDKDNLLHSFAARYNTGQGDILYFGSDRYDNSGDAQQGFWFFQNAIGLGSNSVGGGTGFTGLHTPGDLLVISDFSNGGTTSTITVYSWDPTCAKAGGTCGDANLRILASSSAASCATASGADAFCGIVNSGTITMPWSFTDKSGTPNNGALNGEFFEAGVNLTNLGLANLCFSSVLAETRSSTSTTATLKDFVLGGFGQCSASISSTQSWTPSDSATITVTGAATWTGTVTFSLHASSDCTDATPLYTSDAIAVDNTDASASTADDTTAPFPPAQGSSTTVYWNVHFDAQTPSQLADTDSCVEQTQLIIDNDNTS